MVSTEESVGATQLALIIGNGNYPDATEPLNQPINDATGLAGAMRRRGFDVDMVEDATKADMARAVERLKSRIKPGSVVMLFFGGYGVQSGRESFMIPIDATIWKESDVGHEGISIEAVLDVMKERGARAKLVVLDASRRNPYERRFRLTSSHGLAPINAPNNTLILSSNPPGKVGDDTTSEHSVLVTELLNELDTQVSAEGVFNKTRIAVSRVSNGEQMPSVSSSLLEDVGFSPSENSITSSLPPSPPRTNSENDPSSSAEVIKGSGIKPALTAPPHPICEPMFPNSRGTPAANRAWATRNVTRRRTTDPAIGAGT